MCCVCWIESWGDRVLMVSEWGPSHVWGMLVVSVVSVVRIVWLGPGGPAAARFYAVLCTPSIWCKIVCPKQEPARKIIVRNVAKRDKRTPVLVREGRGKRPYPSS